MYVCGSNNNNQLYVKDFNPDATEIDTPKKNGINPETINSFSTYYNHSVWITKDGSAYGIGNNRECQFDPSSKKKIYYAPTKIKFLQNMFKGEKFVSAVCGESYTLYQTALENDDSEQPILHFVDKNFQENKNSFNFNEEIYIYGGNNYAAIITSSSSQLFIYNELDSYTPVRPFEIKVQDIALCNLFAIAITDNMEAISIPINVKGKMIKFKSLNKYNIQTISGTYDQAVAVASQKENAYEYDIILFQYAYDKKRPKCTTFSLKKFYERNIYFKFVSCAEDYTLLLTYNGTVYMTQNFENYKKINVPHIKFIIAGRNTQTFLTFNPSNYFPNYHLSEESTNNEEEEEEEESTEFTSRNDALLAEKLEKQNKLTSSIIDQLNQEKFTFQSSKLAEKTYTKISTIGNPTFHSETIKVQYSEDDEKKFYALKALKYIHITDYCNLINDIDKFNNNFYHPLVVRATLYNYNIEDLENEKNKKLLQIRSSEEKQADNSRRIEIDPEQDEELSYHNLNIKIKKDIFERQSDFYYPFIMMPYFPQNLFDAVESNLFSNTQKVFIIAEILMTVSYLHDNGIYHQRLTPWNILISESKDAFISDIFNSQYIENQQTIILKNENALWFIDPEIINSDTLDYEQNDDIYKKNHDIYSIGKLIFFILSGSFGKSGKEATFANRVSLQCSINSDQDNSETNLNPVEPIEFPSDFPEYTKKLISDCISFTTEGRPSVKTVLNGIKSVNYQLIPKVNEDIINGRLQAIEEKLQK